MKKIFILLLILFSSLFLVGCKSNSADLMNSAPSSSDSMMKDSSTSSDAMMDSSSNTKMDSSDSMIKDSSPSADSTMKDSSSSDVMMDSKVSVDTSTTASGSYMAYTKSAFDTAKDKKRVYFFHATWCPFCKSADADFTANLSKIPLGVVLFKTDYDKEVALKKQYGITYQHTFVQVDANGKELAKWNGGGVDTLISKLK